MLKRRILSLVIALIMIFGIIPAANAQQTIPSDGTETTRIQKITSEAADNEITIYFRDDLSWGTPDVYVHNVGDTALNAAYPGLPMTYFGKDEQGIDIYSYTFDSSIYTIIKFSKNYGDKARHVRTPDLVYADLLKGDNNGFYPVETSDKQKPNAAPFTFIIEEPPVENGSDFTIYFQDSKSWGNLWGGVWVYLRDGGSPEKLNAAYPGLPATYVGKDKQGFDVYSYTFDSSVYSIVKFSNGQSGTSHERTPDLKYATLFKDNNNAFRLTGAEESGKTGHSWLAEAYTVNPKDLSLVVDTPDTIYFVDELGWGDPYIYSFNSANQNSNNAKYPGVRMKAIGTIGNKKVYSYTVDSTKFDRISFNDGTAASGNTVPDRRTVTGGINYKNDLATGKNGYSLPGTTTLVSGKYYYNCDLISVNLGDIVIWKGIKTDTKVKSVIFMVGDGFSAEHIKAGEINKGAPLVFQTGAGWYRAWQTTHSASYPAYTDSTAAATALATGIKTNNGTAGLDKNGKYLENLIEFSKARGMKTGLVVTQILPHATPAGFSVHDASRDNFDAIATQQIKQSIDVMFGGGATYFNSKRSLITDYEYAYVTNFADLKNVDKDQKVIGVFKDGYIKYNDATTPSLAETTSAALERFGDNPFFVMIEASDIDSYSHTNVMKDMLGEITEFDNAVQVAKDYVDAHPDTLLIVTADHETGGLDLTGVTSKDQLVDSLFKSGSHTSVSVPLHAYGKGAEELTKYNVIDNTEIHNFVTQVLNNEYGERPSNILNDKDNHVIYFEKPESWDTVNIYSESYLSTKNKPGASMVMLHDNIYAYTAPFEVANLKISFNNGDKKSTITIADPQYDKLYYITSGEDTDSASVGVKDYNPPVGVIYLEKPSEWANANIYTWSGVATAAWPGNPMELVKDNIYKYEFSRTDSGFKLIFNDGRSTDAYQTENLDFMGFDLIYNITSPTTKTSTVTFSEYLVKESSVTFEDIQNHWAKEYIEIFAARQISNGINEKEFGPDLNVTRGQFATFIAKAFGIKVDSSYANPYTDVSSGKYYTDAILALTNAGIISGYGNGKFGPNDNITREQMYTMIMKTYSYVSGKDIKKIEGFDKADFADINTVSTYAIDSVKAAKALGIATEIGNNEIAPKGLATRSQAAMLIVELLVKAEIIN